MKNTAKKITRALFGTAVFIVAAAQAQVPRELSSKYQASVLNRVYGVTSKVSLSTEKQMQLASYYEKQDKLANKALAGGRSLGEVAKYYEENSAFLKSLLSPLEYGDYEYVMNSSPSLSAVALHFRTTLQLSQVQIGKLLELAAKGRNLDVSSRHLEAAPSKTQAKATKEILSPQQYGECITIVATPLAVADTRQSWERLVKLGIVTAGDSAKCYPECLSYFTFARTTDAMVSNSDAFEKLDSVRTTFFVVKPLVLMKLDWNDNSLPESQFASALKISRDLFLNPAQTDSLLLNAQKLESARLAFKKKFPYQKYDATMVEGRALTRILNNSQYYGYLNSKNRNNAVINEKKIWARLKSYGLDKGVDSLRVNRNLIDYELSVLVANERYHVNDSPDNAAWKAKVEHLRPDILKKLDVAVKNSAAAPSASKSLSW